EILACEAWAKLGEIPQKDVEKIREKAAFDVERIQEIEAETRHDVVAFTRAVSESLGEERKWVHYGLTSTDVVDTALSYVLNQANNLIRESLVEFIEVLKAMAIKHKHTVMIVRMYGYHPTLTTFSFNV